MRKFQGQMNEFVETKGAAFGGLKVVILGPHLSSATAELLTYAVSALWPIFVYGYAYQKVGVILTDLVLGDYRQKGVFVEGLNEKRLALSGVVDKLNRRHGQDKLRLASQMYNPDWPMRPQLMSPCYTTQWEGYIGGEVALGHSYLPCCLALCSIS